MVPRDFNKDVTKISTPKEKNGTNRLLDIFLLASQKDQKTVERDLNKDIRMGNNERSYMSILCVKTTL